MLIVGPSGSGKSDLALRLIDRGAVLVSDDRTRVTRDGERLLAHAPERMAGCIEVRGLGVAATPSVDQVPISMVVALGAEERLPLPGTRSVAGVTVREVTLDPFRASAPIKVEWALRQPDLPPA